MPVLVAVAMPPAHDKKMESTTFFKNSPPWRGVRRTGWVHIIFCLDAKRYKKIKTKNVNHCGHFDKLNDRNDRNERNDRILVRICGLLL